MGSLGTRERTGLMQQLDLRTSGSDPLRILCLGAHSDDIEIGCGGSLLRILEEYDGAEVSWVVFSALGERAAEAEASAERFLESAATSRVTVNGFRDGFFPRDWAGIKEEFERIAAVASPDIIFTHNGQDAHQDHRAVSELTWNTFRNHLILEYEVIKYDGDLGRPNVYIPLAKSKARQKIKILMEEFHSQLGRYWFTEATFESMMRVRGVEIRADDLFAEAFYGRKVRL